MSDFVLKIPTAPPPFVLISVADNTHPLLGDVRELFTRYLRDLHERLHMDLTFQSVKDEVSNLPQRYARSVNGALLLLRHDDRSVGCIALRSIGDGLAEIKRLYVEPEYRRRRCGRILVAAILDIAVQAQYKRVYLDTVQRLPAANALYKSMGFTECAPYCHNPFADVLFFKMDATQIPPFESIIATAAPTTNDKIGDNE